MAFILLFLSFEKLKTEKCQIIQNFNFFPIIFLKSTIEKEKKGPGLKSNCVMMPEISAEPVVGSQSMALQSHYNWLDNQHKSRKLHIN